MEANHSEERLDDNNGIENLVVFSHRDLAADTSLQINHALLGLLVVTHCKPATEIFLQNHNDAV